jgi:hypothetical protein
MYRNKTINQLNERQLTRFLMGRKNAPQTHYAGFSVAARGTISLMLLSTAVVVGQAFYTGPLQRFRSAF